MEELMRNLTLAFVAAGCLAFAIPPALATDSMSNARPSNDVSAKTGVTNQAVAQVQYNTKKKNDEINKQDQTRRRSWGGG
jgi:hypothetical protein